MQLTFPSALTPASPRSRLGLLPWLASILIVLLVPTALRAETYTLPGTNIELTYSLSGNPATATISDCNETATGALAIPDTLGGAPVTSIGAEAFFHCTGLTSATIPNSVTSIDDLAFSYCYSLTSVTISNSVTSIGGSAFYYCTNLTSVNIPNSVTSIGGSAFYYCTSLTSVTIPNSVTFIGSWAFTSCRSLTSVTIPNSVTFIGSWAFTSCRSLTSVTIPKSVTSIGDGAFSGCSSLTAFIVDPANSDFFSLDGVLFNKAPSVLIQYPSAKTGSTYTIPNSVTSIGSWAFYDCTNLTSVNIPNSVTSIGDGAFSYCTSLTGVTIPNSVTSIGGSAFDFCSSLTSVTIPNSVTFMGDYAFYNCFSLTAFIVDPANSTYCSLDGVLYNKAQSVLIQYPRAKTESTYTIPNSVTSIGDSAFYDCTSLISVTIPNGVISICDYAFSSCSNLTSVTIPNSVTSIGSWAFYYCTSLSSVTIPNSITSIGGSAFTSCFSLTSVTIPNSVTYIGSYAFSFCSNLTSVTIPNSVTNIDFGTFYNCSRLTDLTIPNSVTSIGEAAFYYCSSLTSVNIPKSVTSIGDSAFSYCLRLKSATFIGNAPVNFGYNVFYNTDSAFTIYYWGDALGFTTPTWKGYPTSVMTRICILGLSGNLDFGAVFLNQTSTQTLTLSNTGNATLTVSAITFPTGFSGNWSNGTIAAGSSQNITVSFTPTQAIAYSGTITITANETSGTNSIACSGAGVLDGLALIPSGEFQMGDSLGDGYSGDTSALPVHTVHTSSFYIGRTDVTKAQWDVVRTWGSTHGYTDLPTGIGKGSNHPVLMVSWYDCVKWCNARSESEGLLPVYSVSGSVFRTGQIDPTINYSASGYRLPTEAEWEKAARGGLSGQRFPWGNTISHSQANYISYASYPYDISPTHGFHPTYYDGVEPYTFTSPVGSFAPNGYGLYDMAGNVNQWCGDWYGPYSSTSSSNPTGPGSGSLRVLRSGDWGGHAINARVSSHGGNYPTFISLGLGFRLARSFETSAITCIIGLSGNLNFGAVFLNQTATQTLTLSNTGNAPLTVTAITYPPGFSGNWSSGTIAAEASQAVMVSFTPTQAIAYAGTITITADQTSGTYSIACSGTGVPVATFADWSSTAFTQDERNDPTISGPLADPANSGLNNLIRYAYSLSRTDTNSPNLPVQTVIIDTASNNNAYNTIDFTVRNDPQLTYRIEVSSDMVNWHFNGDGQGGPYVTVTTVDNEDGTTSVHAQDLTPVADTQPRYSRVVLVYP